MLASTAVIPCSLYFSLNPSMSSFKYPCLTAVSFSRIRKTAPFSSSPLNLEYTSFPPPLVPPFPQEQSAAIKESDKTETNFFIIFLLFMSNHKSFVFKHVSLKSVCQYYKALIQFFIMPSHIYDQIDFLCLVYSFKNQ